MADIIPLEEKFNLLKNKKDALDRKRKIQAVQNVFRCVRCAFKCEKCGTSIDQQHGSRLSDVSDVKIPYNFCDSCKEEYQDYISYLKGETNPKYYWYSDTWANLWRRWIDYQSSLDNYLKSKEFKALLMEMRHSIPEDHGG